MLQVSALNHQRQSEHKNFKENSIPLLKFDFSLSPLVNRVKLKGLSYQFLIIPLNDGRSLLKLCSTSTWAGSVHRAAPEFVLESQSQETADLSPGSPPLPFSSPPVVSLLLQALPSHVSPEDAAESWFREQRDSS